MLWVITTANYIIEDDCVLMYYAGKPVAIDKERIMERRRRMFAARDSSLLAQRSNTTSSVELVTNPSRQRPAGALEHLDAGKRLLCTVQ